MTMHAIRRCHAALMVLLAVAFGATVAVAQEKGSIALLCDTDGTRYARALEALYGERLHVFNFTERQLGQETLKEFDFLVTEVREPDSLDSLDLQEIREFARDGGIVVMALDEFAAMHDLRVTEERLENRRRDPELTRQQMEQLWEAVAQISPNVRHSDAPKWIAPLGNLPEPWMNETLERLLDEMSEAIPRIELVAEEPELTRGFREGHHVPWCGNEDGYYVQRQILTIPYHLEDQLQVIAVSNLNRRPVFLREQVGEGTIYALDLRSLGEPATTWETRGAFNKYAFVGNVIGVGLEFGTYWQEKPKAEDWEQILSEVAEAYPALRVEPEGFDNGYRVYSLNIGDPDKPIWYVYGMYHAEDEWAPGLATVDFMRYLAENQDRPEIRARLEQFQVKAIPCQSPTMYMKSLRGEEPGPQEPFPPGAMPERERPQNMVVGYSLHTMDGPLQYGLLPFTAESLRFPIDAINALQQQRVHGKFIEWEGDRPYNAEERIWGPGDDFTPELAESFRYYGGNAGFASVAHIGEPELGQLEHHWALEVGRRGMMPERWLAHYQLRTMLFYEDTYRSAVINDLVTSAILTAFLNCPEPPDGMIEVPR